MFRTTTTMLAAWLVTGVLLLPLAADDSRPPATPNVVMFVVDDMGWVDCGAYGSQYYETPNIDRLAGRGMLFTDAYSANPLCSPTRASILTGKYPARLGLTTAAGHQPPRPADAPRYPERAAPNRPTLQPQSLHYLAPAERTIAEALRAAGYRTGHFGKWHLGLTEPYWPERQGFDVAWHGHPDPGPIPPNGYFSPYSFRTGTITPGPEGEYIVDRLTDEAIRFLDDNRDRPFLLHVWQYGVHGPWDHKVEYTREFAKKTDPRGKQGNPIMASMLRSVDESLGRIVQRLEELGLTERTIIIFTSDNGGNVHSNIPGSRQAQRRDGRMADWRKWAGDRPPTNNAPLRDGKGTLYEGGVRIPLVVVWPGVIEAGSRSSELVSTIDFHPTVLDLLGIEPQPKSNFDGISIAPVLRDAEARLDREAVFNFFPHGGPTKPPGVTVRSGEWKLIRWFETSSEYPSRHELYNLKEDLGETKNLARERPELVARLDAGIDRFLKETGALVPKPNPAYDRDAALLQGWVNKFSRVSVADDVLRMEADGRRPFLATVRLSGAGPLELRVRMRSPKAGRGSVQWRTADQETFPAEGQVARFEVPAGWQEVSVTLPVEGELAHLRLFPPLDEQAVEIDWIELWSAGDAPARRHARWDFDARKK